MHRGLSVLSLVVCRSSLTNLTPLERAGVQPRNGDGPASIFHKILARSSFVEARRITLRILRASPQDPRIQAFVNLDAAPSPLLGSTSWPLTYQGLRALKIGEQVPDLRCCQAIEQSLWHQRQHRDSHRKNLRTLYAELAPIHSS